MEIRNFAIIAHIDHGKSTLADRIMEICGAVGKDHPQQLLDSLELEREHGITIKLKAIRLVYRLQSTDYSQKEAVVSSQKAVDGSEYILNLIDTPGHVDFSYEVSRSLASVEGAVLVVDATQGVQAQTLANFNLALGAKLTLIPVINKIDSPQAEVKKTTEELVNLGFSREEIIKVSAKTGEGVEDLIKEIITRIPEPKRLTINDKLALPAGRLSALIFDSSLDPYKGVVATVRLFGGQVSVGDKIRFIATAAQAEVLQIGYLTPKPTYVDKLKEGEVGFIVTNLKDSSKVKVGDTISLSSIPNPNPLPGYQEAKPVVFLSFFPTDPHDLPKLKIGLEKLKLNDSSLSFASETSTSLGQGFRLGFLGLLHAQITQERLEREYDLDIIVASPSVNFEIDGRVINKPSDFDPTAKSVREPYALVTIFAPQKYYGAISQLIYEKRGEQTNLGNVGASQKIEAKIPLLEILIGFYDQLKTVTSGYASFDFEVSEYRDANLVKLDILVNHQSVEGLAQIVPRERAEEISRKLVEKLKEAIPRQQIPVPIQAAIGSKIIARETVPAFRKDVTQKLYGG
ncbi:elongation factor 4, partial [Candidatus Curtissbacteria bacterium]|nr:elongation factor 4 [Candidatus Curtissbacteria bacterium]